MRPAAAGHAAARPRPAGLRPRRRRGRARRSSCRASTSCTAFATTHTIPSLGYVVWERRNKLKEEYHGLPGDKIRDLRLSGVEVTREVRTPLLAYTGDTSPGGPRRLPAGVRGEDPDHRDELHPPQPPPREDPQVRPHAPGRLPRAGRPVQERADHLPPTSARATTPTRCGARSRRGCRRGCASGCGCGSEARRFTAESA